jgi:virulence factor Mce-like protein
MKLFDRPPGQFRPNLVVRGLVVVAIFGALMLILYGRGIPFMSGGGQTVKAIFASAPLNARPGKTPVRVRGVNIGQVTAVQRAPGGDGVLVTMQLDDARGYALHQDAHAHLYWRTLLGFNYYVQLDPGSPSAPPLSDHTIPLSRTTTQVMIDQVLDAINAPSRAGIRAMLSQFDQGFDNPAPVEQTLANLSPSMNDLGPGLSALQGTQPGDLTTLVRGTSRLMGTLARSEVDLGGLINSADTSLAVTAARNTEIGETLQSAPGTMQQTQDTMVRLRGTIDALDPLAERLVPGAQELAPAATVLQPALAELRGVLAKARPLLGELQPALVHLQAASRQGAPLLTGMMPTLGRTSGVLIPWLKEQNPDTNLKNFEAVGPTFATVGSSAAMFDGYSHIQRFGAANAGSANSAGFLPCNTDVGTAQTNCNDLGTMLNRLFGVPSQARLAKGSTR